MPSFEALRSWLQRVQIVHHLCGRIRLKLAAPAGALPAGAGTGVKAREAQAVLASVRGIRALRVNALARSCTVEYDPQHIPMDAWPDLLAGRDSAAARTLEAVLRQAYQEIADAASR